MTRGAEPAVGDPRLAVAAVAAGPAMRAVAGGNDGFVAVGGDTVWVSSAGRVWERVVDPGLPARVELRAVVRSSGGTFVAAGTASGRPLLVGSRDGRTWQRGVVPGDATIVDAVFPTSPLVAVGRRATGEVVMWTSGTEGERWAPAAPVGAAGASTTGRPLSIAGGGELPLVAVLERRSDAPLPARRPLLALSNDGRSWATVEPGGVPATADVRAVAVVGRRLVAIGTDGQDARAWTSSDGRTWTAVVHDEDEAGGDGFQVATRLTADGPMGVAMGEDAGAAAVWAMDCTAGCGLRRVRGRPAAPVADVAADRVGRIVAVGGAASAAAFAVEFDRAPSTMAAAWGREVLGSGRAVGVTAWGRGWVAVGTRGDDAVGWVDDDGRGRWREVGLGGGPGGQRATAVVATSTGLLAVGHDDAGGDVDAVVWTSSDGLTWSRSSDPLLGGPGNQTATAVAAARNGVVVVAGDDDATGGGDAAAWLGRGGRWERAVSDPLGLGGPGVQSIRAVTSTADGWTAVGVEAAAGALDAVVWESPDGLQWSRAVGDRVAPGGGGDQALVSVVPGVAGGYTQGGRADADGLVATLGPEAAPEVVAIGGNGHQTVNAITRVGSGHIAAGVDGPDAVLWRSDDGRGWARTAQVESVFGGDGDQFVLGIAAGTEGEVVAVGGDDGVETGGRPTALAWRLVDRGGVSRRDGRRR